MTHSYAGNVIKNPNYSILKDPMMMHSEDKPLSFSKFDKKFQNSSILKDHIMVHSVNK